MASVLDIIKHYQQSIEKYSDDEAKVLRCIDKLFQLKVTVQHLQETGVGRTVNALRKEPGDVGQAARALVLKWKTMVAAEESDQEGDHRNDTPTQNGHGSGRESDEHMQQSRSSNDQYTSKISTPKLNNVEPQKEMNGHHSGTKRKYHSSEEENHHDRKKKSRDTSLSEDDYKRVVVKKEKLSDSESSGEDSESSESDSESYSSDSSHEEVKVKTEIKQEIKKERESPDRNKSSSKHSHSHHVEHKKDLSSSKRQDSDTHSHHKSSSKQESSHTQHYSESSSKSTPKSTNKSSHEKENSSEKKHKSESSDRRHKSSADDKRHKSDTSSDEKKEPKSSSKHSSEKHKSSSHKHDSSSERHKSSSDNQSSKDHKSSSHSDKHKSSSVKEISKHKSKESSSSSSKEKHSSSSKDKSKERSTSSNDRSTHSHHSDKKHSSGDSKSHSSDKSRHKSDSSSSEKRTKEKSSSSLSHKSKSGSSSSKSKEDVPKKKVKLSNSEDSGEDGIDCGSGASFAEALGMISPTKPKKKIKDVNSPSNSFNNDLSPAALLAPSAKLAPLPHIEISALPEISPNYKPRPPPKLLPHFTDEDAISAGISSKNQRTKVYSGNKVIGKITSLYEMCVHVLQEHIDALEYTGGVPYDILKPVVDRASPNQLFLLEHYNPYLMEDTDHLWKQFCDKSFRNKKRQELESWREMFIRCQEEQEHKLKSLTANIKLTQEAKKAPIKQTKMAYVDSIVKPPRNIARKQAQHGTAHAATASPASRVASLAATPGLLKGGAPRPPPAAAVSASAFNKPKKAPLMQKALQFMRGRKR